MRAALFKHVERDDEGAVVRSHLFVALRVRGADLTGFALKPEAGAAWERARFPASELEELDEEERLALDDADKPTEAKESAPKKKTRRKKKKKT